MPEASAQVEEWPRESIVSQPKEDEQHRAGRREDDGAYTYFADTSLSIEMPPSITIKHKPAVPQS